MFFSPTLLVTSQMLPSTSLVTSQIERNATPPPPYESSEPTDPKEKFARAFTSLASDHQDIMLLFKDVTLQLHRTPDFGPHHHLTKEWDSMRQEHKQIYRESKRQAHQCAVALTQYIDIMEVISNSSSAVSSWILHLDQFKLHIEEQTAQARDSYDKFDALIERIEKFQVQFRVAVGLDPTGAQGLFMRLWSEIVNGFTAVANAIKKVLDRLVHIIKQLGSILDYIHIRCGMADFKAFFTTYSSLPDKDEKTGSEAHALAPEDIDRDINSLKQKLCDFRGAWRKVEYSCQDLTSWLTLAHQTRTESLPEFRRLLRRHCEDARKVYVPLKECMRAYAEGEDPTL